MIDFSKVITAASREKEVLEAMHTSEREWRNAELARADIQLLKAEDGMPVGTQKSWRVYRVALRNWPNDPAFPSVEARPVAPDA